MNPRLQAGFWNLGTQLMGVLRKNTLFADKPLIHPEESEEDNFDLVYETAEKIDILRPILRPQLLMPLLNEIETNCVQILKQTLDTFLPNEKIVPETQPEGKTVEKAEDVPDWLKKFMPQKTEENSDTKETTPNETNTEQDVDKEMGPPMVKVKKRLRRRESDFDKITKLYMPANEVRDQMIGKAKCIFNTIIDTKDETVSVSSVLTHLQKFEAGWVKFPKDEASLKVHTSEKINNRSRNTVYYFVFML